VGEEFWNVFGQQAVFLLDADVPGNSLRAVIQAPRQNPVQIY
jgi:hypothetical protein